MSTEQQSIHPDLVEQTKQQIRSLVSEVAQLARSDLAPEEFYGEFLNRVVSALAALGGAVWALDDEDRLALQYHINLQQTGLRENEEGQRQHSRLLNKALSASEPILVPPRSGAGEEGAANPTDFLLVLGPIRTDLQTVGVVEIFQRSEAGPNTQKGYLRFVGQMCELAADFAKNRQLRHFSHRQALWSQLEEFTRVVHASLDPRATAYTVANEGRQLIDCDRVSVALRRGRKCVIEAISGQDMFDKRSNTVRLLGELATRVIDTGDAVWYTGNTEDMAPQVEDAVQQYVDEAHTKMVAVLPLKPPAPSLDEEEDLDRRTPPAPPVGALIVEQIEDARLAETMVQRVEVVCRHSASALTNAAEHHSLFLMPLWRALGKSKVLVGARMLPKTVSVLVAIVGVVGVLTFWPADFNVNATGSLEPVIRRDVFARLDGNVIDLAATHGAVVREGDYLLRMRSTEMEVARTQILGEITAKGQRLAAIERELQVDRRLQPEEKERLEGERQALEKEIESFQQQLLLYRQKAEDLNVRSPIDGVVITWDLEQKLLARPLQRGQVLMQVADPTGPWRVELDVPEYRMGYLRQAQRELEENLPVSFILATDPGTRHQGRIEEVHLAAEPRGEEGHAVLVKVSIDAETLEALRPNLHPRAAVQAKVYCGRRSLGYVWFHDLVAFVRSRILFRFF